MYRLLFCDISYHGPVVLNLSNKPALILRQSMPVGVQLEIDASRRQFRDLLRVHNVKQSAVDHFIEVELQKFGQPSGEFTLVGGSVAAALNYRVDASKYLPADSQPC